jgi:GTP pyrophosphokinase
LGEELKNEHIQVIDIHARKKHTYSLYKKLLKYEMDLEKITDIVALRVIVPTIEACYGTLGVIHKLWPPMPGKIKDYIALSKPNGYRSLHTTVFGPDGRPVEIQVRTPEMHAEAESGIAAHWAYTEFKKTESKSYKEHKHSFAKLKQAEWIQQLREWQKDIENPDEFLESLKIDFFKNRIFVLTPKGDVFDLPEGSTPIDVAYRVHTEVGNAAVGARINGKMVALDHPLRNGDVIEILTQKNKKPNPDWLQVVKSTEARKKISSFMRKMEEERKFQKPGGETVEFRLTVHDRLGLLRDVTEAFAQARINLKSVVTETKNRTFPVLIIQAPLKNRNELEKLMVALKKVKGVEEVGYKLL